MSDVRLQDGSVKRRADLKANDVIRLEGGEAVVITSLSGVERTRLEGGELQKFADVK